MDGRDLMQSAPWVTR